MLDSRLPVPGLLQLPLLDEVRAGIEKHVAKIIDPGSGNTNSEAAVTAQTLSQYEYELNQTPVP